MSQKNDFGTICDLILSTILPAFPKGWIVVSINQDDLAMKGVHLDNKSQRPNKQLKTCLEDMTVSIQRRMATLHTPGLTNNGGL